MSDVTTIVVALASGGFGVAGGWITGRQNMKVTDAQLAADQAKAEAQLAADRWKTDDERRHDAFERRLENYRDFLDTERGLRVLLASSAEFEHKEYQDWFTRFHSVYNLLILTGSSDVRGVATKLLKELKSMEDERVSSSAAVSFAAQARAAYKGREERITEVRDELINTMRSDFESETRPSDG